MAIPSRPARGRKPIRRRPGKRIVEGKGFRLADEVRYIQRRATDHHGRFGTIGQLVLFSTRTGGAWTLPIGSRQGWLETGRANRSTSRKPIRRSRLVGRAAIASTDRRSFTPIEIPAGSPPSSAIRPRGSFRPSDRKISNMFG